MNIVSIIGNNISRELFLVYGLIIAVILLIAVILIVDKVKSRKKDNLFDSRKLSKRLNNLRLEAERAEQEEKQAAAIKEAEKQVKVEAVTQSNVEESIKKTPTIMPNQSVSVTPIESVKPSTPEKTNVQETPGLNNRRVEPIIEKQNHIHEEIEILDSDEKKQIIQTNDIDQSIWETDTTEEIYQEPELEKTQAQIDVEAITRELEKAVNDEQAIDKYAKFEEEQEKDAIISYVELKEKFDKLYNENEKTQYMNDDSLPINMEELYRSQVEAQSVQPQPSTIQQISSELHTTSTVEKALTVPHQTTVSVANQQQNPVNNNIPRTTRFKSSPMISPVYGIQQEPVVTKNTTNVAEMEAEIQRTNEFLQSLKDLQKNLE